MADADYDFGGGLLHDRRDRRPEAAASLTASKAQRYIRLAGGLSSIVLVVGLGIWGYKLAVRDVNGVPVIQALDSPMRIAPDDPGGEIASHQGLAVNDVAEIGTATPPPEKLILAPRPVELADEDTVSLAGQAITGLEEASAPTDLLTGNADLALAAAPVDESADPTEVAIDAALSEALGEPVEPVPLVAPDLNETLPEGVIATSIRPKASPRASLEGSAQAQAETLIVAMEETAPTDAVTAPLANEVDPTTIAAGTRLVQFGTFDTAEAARAEWTRLQGRFGELMVDKTLVIQPAERGGLIFYRLRAHGFEGEDDARRFCTAFVTQQAICIPVAHQ